MARPRNMAPWMALSLELGFDPSRVLAKVRNLRAREAGKFGVSILIMEVIYGWNLDEMAMSLLHAIQHERCRGPRCGRVKFAELISNQACLSLITGDIIDPGTEPMFCLNFRWCCERDNKGDRDAPMRDRVQRLVTERLVNMHSVNEVSVNTTEVQQPTLFDL